jgi:hypothetical protein
MKKTKIYMGIPSMGDRCDGQVYALRHMEKAYAGSIELVYPEQCIHRFGHDFARNATVEEFLKTDCDMLWFLDSDIHPPDNILDLVTKQGEHWELAGSPYPVFMEPVRGAGLQAVMCVYESDHKGMHLANCPPSGTKFVAGLATGCMFIKREVFAGLEKPYFEFKRDPQSGEVKEGEDLGFCRKVNVTSSFVTLTKPAATTSGSTCSM